MKALLATIAVLGLSLNLVYANISGQNRVRHNHKNDESSKPLGEEEEHLYIHLIPHTHDDVGWLKTVDMYYSGCGNNIQAAEVHLILDSTIDELLEDSSKRFTYVEMKFFSMWWGYQTEQRKQEVRMLVQEGRLEFVNAGWSMHDEACTHYEDMINNMMHGHQFLLKEFGVKPTIGWHVDPFGHSLANPRLFADMGFDAWFFARIDYEDKDNRLESQELQWIWRPFYNHFGSEKQIWTGTMQDHYCWPTGFWYDERFDGDEPVVTNENLETFNADVKVYEMYQYAKYQMAPHYLGNHVLIPMGCDFTYANARMTYQSTDRLISYFNKVMKNATIMYSTPSEYLNALKAQNLSWPVRYDDMFPYADQAEDYWTGYFTSRANSKSQVRQGQAELIGTQKLASKMAINNNLPDEAAEEAVKIKNQMMDSMGLYQHHDAVAGTAQQYVANDYNFILSKTLRNNSEYESRVIGQIAEQTSGINGNWEWCTQNNDSYLQCPISYQNYSNFILALYNPSFYEREFIKIKVAHPYYNVSDLNTSNPYLAEVICQERLEPNSVTYFKDCELHIKVDLKGDELRFVKVSFTHFSDSIEVPQSNENVISNNHEGYEFLAQDEESGMLNFRYHNAHFPPLNLTFGLRYYKADQGGDNYPNSDNCPSGAYIFKPSKEFPNSLLYSNFTGEVKTFNGSFVQEMQFHFLNWSSQEEAFVKLTTYRGQNVTKWTVITQGIPLSHQGQEVVVYWQSKDIKNNKTFYTDSNGLAMQERILNYRPTFNLSTHENVSANYYPVNSAIAIRDYNTQLQMTVMNDRSQAGSSIDEGSIELMQNRRLYYDDYRGVGEALNETDSYGNGITVVATYTIQIFNFVEQRSQQRKTQVLNDEPVQAFYAFNYSHTPSFNMSLTPLEPYYIYGPGVFKYAIFPMAKNDLILRIENIEDNFDLNSTYNSSSSSFEFDVEQFAQLLYYQANQLNGTTQLNNIQITELTLTGNQERSEANAKKTQWKIQGEEEVVQSQSKILKDEPGFRVDMYPQDIRTFRIKYIPFEPYTLINLEMGAVESFVQ